MSSTQTTTAMTVHPSPVGPLTLGVDADGALTLCWFNGGRHTGPVDDTWRRAVEPFAAAIEQLDAYFAGELQTFDLVTAPVGSPFQLDVWRALVAIPFGATASYGELATQVGRPGAARAVGAANGRNPISIIVPCHRVIGSGGALVGFGGGLDRKRWLLDHERSVCDGQGRLIA